MKKLTLLSLIIVCCINLKSYSQKAEPTQTNIPLEITESEKEKVTQDIESKATKMETIETAKREELAKEEAAAIPEETTNLQKKCKEFKEADNKYIEEIKNKLKEIYTDAKKLEIPETEEVVFLFAHGLWGSGKQATWYAPTKDSNWYIMNCPYYTFNFPDVQTKNGEVVKGKAIREKVNIGQDIDIAKFLEEYKKVENQNPNKKIVLVGQSRGAMTIINALATNPEDFKNVKAIILESPGDDPFNVVKNYFSWGQSKDETPLIDVDPVLSPIVSKIFSYISQFASYSFSNIAAWLILKYYYPAYDPDGIKPIDVVDKIDKNIPILIIHSEEDEMTPMSSPENLYKKLKDSNHKVEFLKLKNGLHGKYNCPQKPKENKECLESAQEYMAATNLFYMINGIPFDPEIVKKFFTLLEKQKIKQIA